MWIGGLKVVGPPNAAIHRRRKHMVEIVRINCRGIDSTTLRLVGTAQHVVAVGDWPRTLFDPIGHAKGIVTVEQRGFRAVRLAR